MARGSYQWKMRKIVAADAVQKPTIYLTEVVGNLSLKQVMSRIYIYIYISLST